MRGREVWTRDEVRIGEGRACEGDACGCVCLCVCVVLRLPGCRYVSPCLSPPVSRWPPSSRLCSCVCVCGGGLAVLVSRGSFCVHVCVRVVVQG